MKFKTKQTYDVKSVSGVFYGRFTSLVAARKKACQMAYTHVGERNDVIIVKNAAILADGTHRPAFNLVTVKCFMFIRPRYDYKYFGRERGEGHRFDYKYYLIDPKTGNVSMTSSSFEMYFRPGFQSSGVWNRPRK